jgi:hypothetical protein
VRKPFPPFRPLAVLVALALPLVALQACGSSEPDGGTTTTTEADVDDGTTTTAAGSTDDGASVDPTHLPVGDDHFSTTPKVGYVNTCRSSFDGGGAAEQGPWFNDDGTWDSTKKGVVDGEVEWTSKLSVTADGTDRNFTSNDLPSHTTGEFPIAADENVAAYDRNPNSISEQSFEFSVPQAPTEADSATCVGGEVGFLLSGAVLFDALDAGGRDAAAWEAQDHCSGHPQMSGAYHYHSLPACVPDPGDEHSALLGYAFDGFGIYGYRGEDGTEVTNDDLDECHGHTHTITWDEEEVSMYHYHATREFPYTVGCFRGTPSTQGLTGP